MNRGHVSSDRTPRHQSIHCRLAQNRRHEHNHRHRRRPTETLRNREGHRTTILTNLTPEVEEQIIQLKSEGVGYNTLAKRLSVSVKTIRKVLSQNA